MSEVKVNKISPRTNCGTVTLGDSGDTFTIPAGATITNSGTATGFGATGAVNWDVASIKTSTFTATAGVGYFVNTTGGAVTVNLPAGSAGDVVGVSDYANNFATAKCTIAPNGSEKMGGIADDATLEIDGVAVTLVYVDGTKGWIVTDSGNQTDSPTASFITATGGNQIDTCGNYKMHVFTAPGTFTVCTVGNSAGSNTVDYLVVAGGGSAGKSHTTPNGASGGGAGGFRLSNYYASPAPNMSPLASPTNITVSAQGYPIVVGGGGAGTPTGCNSNPGAKGNDSTFSTITSTGGGLGSGNQDHPEAPGNGGPGGSGGGGHQVTPGGNTTGVGNTPPVSPPQGNPGGGACSPSGNGGGGSGGVGGAANSPSTNDGGAGGIGSIVAKTEFAGCHGVAGPSPATRLFAGGGGGSNSPGRSPSGSQGSATGGGGSAGSPGGTNGTDNTGGGGGSAVGAGGSGNGGSGIVIIKYKYQ